MQRLHDGFVLGGRYRIATRIAAGGMGEVWSGLDDVTGRPVAVKVMHPHTADELLFAQRFRDEARHAASLVHPNIIDVYDCGDDDGLAFLVMELVPGGTVAQLIESSGRLRPATVRSIVRQVASALGIAHRAGLVHRDVKPSNILVRPDGVAKLTDFGIVHATDGAGLTRPGEMIGSPHYISPEQAAGAPASPASDLYSLGAVAHEMLTGNKPFDRGTPLAIALAHVMDPPPELPADTPADLAAVVGALLAKDPAGRPASTEALLELLDA